MCSVEARKRKHKTVNDDTSSGGRRPMPYISAKYVLILFGQTINLIESWIKSFKNDYDC